MGDEGLGVVVLGQKQACLVFVSEDERAKAIPPTSSLSRLTPRKRYIISFRLVGDEGLEPPTSSLSVTRSNQLS